MKKKMICFLLIVLCSFGFIDVRAKVIFIDASCTSFDRTVCKYVDCSTTGWKTIDEDEYAKLKISTSSGNFCGGTTSNDNKTCDLGCVAASATSAVSTTETLNSLKKLYNISAGDLPSGTTLDNGGYCRSICFDSDSYTTAKLPTEAVKQGTRFVWGGNDPLLTVSATRECVVSFDYNSWNAEYSKLKDAISNLKEKLESDKSPTKTTSCSVDVDDYEYSMDKGDYACPEGKLQTKYSCPSSEKINIYGKEYTIKYKLENNRCVVDKSKSNLEGVLDGLVDKINSLSDEANGCSGKIDNIKTPTVCTSETAAYVSYDDEVYGYKTDSGKKETLVEYLVPNMQGGNDSGAYNNSIDVTTYKYDDKGSVSSEEKVKVPIFRTTSTTVTVDWYLKEDFYTCVSIDGYSYLRADKCKNNDRSNTWLSGYSESFGSYSNYVILDTPNFPVNFNSKIGKHSLTLTYECNGKKGGDCGYYVSECINGKCPEVENGECDPSKENCDNGNDDNDSDNGMINIIYRVIDLNNPFPNREPGSNWNKENYVKDYITNNRDVETDAVYSEKKPMYEIDLDPSLIKEIRNDYKDVNYGDMNLYCTNGNECRSEFVKELYENGKLSGCGTNSNFNACESGD